MSATIISDQVSPLYYTASAHAALAFAAQKIPFATNWITDAKPNTAWSAARRQGARLAGQA
jgi:hypothetical protein